MPHIIRSTTAFGDIVLEYELEILQGGVLCIVVHDAVTWLSDERGISQDWIQDLYVLETLRSDVESVITGDVKLVCLICERE